MCCSLKRRTYMTYKIDQQSTEFRIADFISIQMEKVKANEIKECNDGEYTFRGILLNCVE